LSLQAAIITQGDQRVRGVDAECMLAGKIGGQVNFHRAINAQSSWLK
jgi:hypothetical protein